MPSSSSSASPSRLLPVSIVATMIGWMLAVILRLTLRDRIDGLAPFYYGTPWPVLAVVMAWPALWWWRHERPRTAAVALSAGLACVGVWLATSWTHAPAKTTGGSLRIQYQNVSHPHARDWPNITELLTREQPDIFGFVEAAVYSSQRIAELRAAFPQHVVRILPDGLVFGVRGAIAENHHVTLGDHSRCHVVRITVDGRSLTVVLVDLESSPFQSRREWFARLEAELARLRDESIVVLGDFNTPRESVYFRSWRGRFQHAFEVAGRGFTETWPAPLPLLCLDHVWVSNDWRVLQCRKPWHPPHDHFGLVVDLGE